MSDALQIVLAIAIGISLSACCGLRAFLPPLMAGLLARFGHLQLHEHFQALSTTPALLALSVACVLELAGDKIPALDHLLDVAATPLRTISGMLVATAAFAPLPTWAAVLLGIVAGGAALSVHATKATARAGSTVTTAGFGNPILSVVEDVLCVIGSVLAPLLWFVAVVMALGAMVLAFFAARIVWRRLRARHVATA